MAIRNANLGGSDWGNETLTYGDLNDTVDVAIIRTSTSALDSTEYSVAASGVSAYDDLGYSKTFTPPTVGAKSMLLGMKINYEVKVDANSAFIRAKLTNNTTGAVTVLTNDTLANAAGGERGVLGPVISNTTYAERTEYATINGVLVINGDDIANQDFDAGILGATYTLTFEAFRQDASNAVTVYIDEITVSAYWTGLGDSVVEGWA